MRRISIFAVGAAALVAACSDGDPQAGLIAPALPILAIAPPVSAPPHEIVARAATLAQEQPGYRFTFEMSLQGLPEAAGAGFTLGGTGAVDQQGHRSAMSLDLGGLRDLLVASGDATSTELDQFLGDGRIELIEDAGTVYVKMPFLAQQLGTTTPWVAATVPAGQSSELDGLGTLGAFAGVGGLGSAGSPADYLAQLKALDASVHESGTEVVRDVQTTRYSGTLDLRGLLGESLPPDQSAQLSAMPLLDAFRLPYDVWIDGNGLPRRITTTLDFGSLAVGNATGPGTGAATPAMVFSYELFDYGSAFEIAVPPTSQVTLIDPALLSSLQD